MTDERFRGVWVISMASNALICFKTLDFHSRRSTCHIPKVIRVTKDAAMTVPVITVLNTLCPAAMNVIQCDNIGFEWLHG